MSYKKILEGYANAVYTKDVESFISIYDTNVCVYDTWKEWTSIGTGKLRDMAAEWFDSLGNEKVKVEFLEVNVLESADQTVWIGEVKFFGLNEDDQVLRSISNRWTWVIKNNNGIFKIVHEHSSLPINMETFTAIMKTY